MRPDITTLLAAAAKAAQNHATAVAAHQSAHAQIIAQRASQPPAGSVASDRRPRP